MSRPLLEDFTNATLHDWLILGRVKGKRNVYWQGKCMKCGHEQELHRNTIIAGYNPRCQCLINNRPWTELSGLHLKMSVKIMLRKTGKIDIKQMADEMGRSPELVGEKLKELGVEVHW